jgi:uncharacterized membrane protein YjjP (DUF1212 family)
MRKKKSQLRNQPTPRGLFLAFSLGLICGCLAHLSGLVDSSNAMMLGVAGFTGAFLVDLGLTLKERPLPTISAFLALGLVAQFLSSFFA